MTSIKSVYNYSAYKQIARRNTNLPPKLTVYIQSKSVEVIPRLYKIIYTKGRQCQ